MGYIIHNSSRISLRKTWTINKKGNIMKVIIILILLVSAVFLTISHTMEKSDLFEDLKITNGNTVNYQRLIEPYERFIRR